jgi:uncharacterized membrane protein
MQVMQLAVTVAGIVVLAVIGLTGYAINRITTAPRRMASVLIALAAVIGAVPAVIYAFNSMLGGSS